MTGLNRNGAELNDVRVKLALRLSRLLPLAASGWVL